MPMDKTSRKQRLFAAIEAEKENLYQWGADLYALPEPGYREFETGQYIRTLAEGWGLCCESLSYTGLRVRLGRGKPHVCLLLDMDALPRTDGSGYIHSCGHSIQTAVGLGVLDALRDQPLAGTLDVIFTPAEEMIQVDYRDSLIQKGLVAYPSGKQDMIAKGVFDGADCVLSCHANGETTSLLEVDSTLTGFLVLRAAFAGASAHSGFAPQLGKNSLHGAMLALTAIQYLKERFSPQEGVSIQPVITEPGGTINMVPSATKIETYVRALTQESLFTAADQVEAALRHCGAALGLGVTVERRPGFLPLRQDPALSRVVEDNMHLLAAPGDILRGTISGASGDVGDLSSLLPTIQMGFSGIRGRFHSDDFTVSDPYNAYVRTTQVLCGAILDLMDQGFSGSQGFAQRKEAYLKTWLGA